MKGPWKWLITITAFILCGCDGDNMTTSSTSTPMTAVQSRIVFGFSGLQPLMGGFHYEGWAIVGGSPVSTGKFNISASGEVASLDGGTLPGGEFTVNADLSSATTVVLTIEPAGDTDTTPAATKIMGGELNSGSASLVVSHGSSLGNNFQSATGNFILATPTNGSGNNELSGVWFLSLAGGGPSAGLQLPTLPDGWAYEGWAVNRGGPISTGTFLDVSATDAMAPFSGPEAGPPFPGEDFLVNAPSGQTFPTNLAGATMVISIEPSPDDSPAPFTLKPLVGSAPGDASDHLTYSLANNSAGFPTGTATVQ